MLSDFILTTADRDTALEQIETLGKVLYKTELADFNKVLDKETSRELSEVIRGELGDNREDRGKIREALSTLSSELQKMPVLSLTLSFTPSGKMSQNLTRRARELFGPEAILELHKDPAVLAGAQVAIGGVYVDNTVRRKLEEYWTQKKFEI